MKLAKIRLLALDVDGVLTEGGIHMGAAGELYKSFNAKDGLGLSLALRQGLQVAVITGRSSTIVEQRCRELGISLLCQGVKDKYGQLRALAASLGLEQEELAFMGDDLNDLPAFAAAGLKLAPADAAAEVKAAADYVTQAPGGRGAVREAVELLLKAQGLWQAAVAAYSQPGEGSLPVGDRQ